MTLIDAHCHLQNRRLQPLPAGALSGIAGLVCCATGPADWQDVNRVTADAAVPTMAAYGLHPWFVEDSAEGWQDELVARLEADPAAAVGEIGLDSACTADPARQEDAFRRQYALSRDRGRPAVIHCVKAFGQLVGVIEDGGAHPAGFLMHAYGGSVEMMSRFARLGGHFSFGGSITHERHKRVRQAVAACPPDRLLIETDAPDLPPAACAEPNVPANLSIVAAVAAELRGCMVEELADLAAANTRRLFGGPA